MTAATKNQYARHNGFAKLGLRSDTFFTADPGAKGLNRAQRRAVAKVDRNEARMLKGGK